MPNVLNSSSQSILRTLQQPVLGSIANPIQQGEGGFDASPYHLHDTFTDAESTSLALHTPDVNVSGNPWVKIWSSDITIQGNKAVRTGNDVCYLMDVGEANFIMECDFETGALGTSYAKLVARATANVNVGWAAYCRSGEKVHLGENVSNIVDGPTTHAGLVPHTLKFICDGLDMTIIYDGAVEIEHTIVTTEGYGTYAGIMLSRSGAWMDNLRITLL